MRRKILILLTLLLVLAFVFSSCSLDMLARFGSALNNSGTNIFGYNGAAAKKQADEAKSTISSIFNSPSQKDPSPDGSQKTLFDSFQEGLDDIFGAVTIDNGDGQLTIDIDGSSIDVVDEIVEKIALSDDQWNSIQQAVGSLTTTEAQQKFANMMKEPAELGSKYNVKEYLDAFKEELTSSGGTMDPTLDKVLTDAIDSFITEKGDLTKGSVVLLTSAATLLKKINENPPEENPDGEGGTSGLDQYIKKNAQDAISLVNVTLAVLGPNSNVMKSINDFLTDSLGGGSGSKNESGSEVTP